MDCRHRFRPVGRGAQLVFDRVIAEVLLPDLRGRIGQDALCLCRRFLHQPRVLDKFTKATPSRQHVSRCQAALPGLYWFGGQGTEVGPPPRRGGSGRASPSAVVQRGSAASPAPSPPPPSSGRGRTPPRRLECLSWARILSMVTAHAKTDPACARSAPRVDQRGLGSS